jgi:hypothetical protein
VEKTNSHNITGEMKTNCVNSPPRLLSNPSFFSLLNLRNNISCIRDFYPLEKFNAIFREKAIVFF